MASATAFAGGPTGFELPARPRSARPWSPTRGASRTGSQQIRESSLRIHRL